MTQSSDREHRSPLSPARRHESIPELIYLPTPEPSNSAALLWSRVKVKIRVIETVILLIESSLFPPAGQSAEAPTTAAIFTVPVLQYSEWE